MKKGSNKRVLLIYIIVILLLFSLFLSGLYVFRRVGEACNRALEINCYSIDADTIGEHYSGLRIAQISDLHNVSFDVGNERLLQMLAETQPDMIAITGDLVDSERTNIDVAITFAKGAAKIAPCFFVIGNNEVAIEEYDRLEEGLKNAGVVVLHDEAVAFPFNNATIQLIGVDDPYYASYREKLIRDTAKKVAKEAGASQEELERISKALSSTQEQQEERYVKKLKNLGIRKEDFTILLSHRPELFEEYCSIGADVVLTGHAHGGQFRMDGVGGLYAPSQGWFPEYDSGVYHSDDTYMVVSRGLGNSGFPYRINNPPEIVIVDIQ
ncbi:MAG: metallophosphoesterase [Lachnospiraceae bacterium]|nr:metallophosphoesterase [Lachnospiraceae bacterium]